MRSSAVIRELTRIFAGQIKKYLKLSSNAALKSEFEDKAIPDNLHGMCQKWLRFYLDFCKKYHLPPKYEKSLSPFIEKLREKRQPQAQQDQAAVAINLYYDLLNEMGIPYHATIPRPAIFPEHTTPNDKKQNAVNSAPATRVQYIQTMPPPAGSSDPSLNIESPSRPFGLPEMVSPEPQSKIGRASCRERV